MDLRTAKLNFLAKAGRIWQANEPATCSSGTCTPHQQNPVDPNSPWPNEVGHANSAGYCQEQCDTSLRDKHLCYPKSTNEASPEEQHQSILCPKRIHQKLGLAKTMISPSVVSRCAGSDLVGGWRLVERRQLSCVFVPVGWGGVGNNVLFTLLQARSCCYALQFLWGGAGWGGVGNKVLFTLLQTCS